jgi:hypothetical protein
LGLLLQNLGAPLTDSLNERVGVYLTNALTGWEPPSEEVKTRLAQLAFSFAELREEYDAAERVKQEVPILVILGNPPYNAFAGTSPEEEQGLVEPYKEGLIKEWGIKKFNLDDLYVRFFRLAERRIAKNEGVICYISNFSYLGDPSFVVMRQRFLAEFDKLWFDSMNGDSRGTGKLTPEGKPDPSVFSTEYNREGIRVGTAIGLMVRKPQRDPKPTVRFRQFWGVTKRADLLASASTANLDSQYQITHPDVRNRLSFQYSGSGIEYLSWPSVADLSQEPPFRAFIEARRGALIEIEKHTLQSRMQEYYDSKIAWNSLASLGNELTQNAARFDAKKARDKVLKTEAYDETKLRRYTIRPFETRWCYHSAVRPLWNEPRPDLIAQCWKGNQFIVTRLKTEKEAKGSPIYFSSTLADYQTIARNVSTIPLRLRSKEPGIATTQDNFFADSHSSSASTTANLSARVRSYLDSLGIMNLDSDEGPATLIWMHAVAIGYAPVYLAENADGIRGDWPRIPLPATKEALLHSAELGRKIAALLDTEQGVDGVTAGAITDPVKSIAVVSNAGGGALDPKEDLKVTAGWGHAGKGGVTMPGRGKLIERDYTPDERASIERGAQLLGLRDEEALAHLGDHTCDVYLNDVAYWKNIPARVWDYTIGGYQVIKKWLSYRELELLGRPLSPDEAREVMNMARRIAAIVLLEPALDANYQAVKADTYSWPTAP